MELLLRLLTVLQVLQVPVLAVQHLHSLRDVAPSEEHAAAPFLRDVAPSEEHTAAPYLRDVAPSEEHTAAPSAQLVVVVAAQETLLRVAFAYLSYLLQFVFSCIVIVVVVVLLRPATEYLTQGHRPNHNHS